MGISGEFENGLKQLQKLHSQNANNKCVESKINLCNAIISNISKARLYAKEARSGGVSQRGVSAENKPKCADSIRYYSNALNLNPIYSLNKTAVNNTIKVE